MIQSVLFDINYWTTPEARQYLNKKGYIPIKRVHTTANYYRYRLIDPNYDKYRYFIIRGKTHIDYIIQIKK